MEQKTAVKTTECFVSPSPVSKAHKSVSKNNKKVN